MAEIPEIVDERLWEWGRYFRDRGRLETCGSAEKYFRAHSEDFAAEGWGEQEKAAPVKPAKPGAVLEAIRTNEVVMGLVPVQKWGVTYWYCYPGSPRFVVLRGVKRFTGHRLNWQRYLEQVEIARLRVSAVFDSGFTDVIKPRLSFPTTSAYR